MELSLNEVVALKQILESLASSCEVEKGEGANVREKGVWLNPYLCGMISNLIDKTYCYLFDEKVGSTLLSEYIYQGSDDVK